MLSATRKASWTPALALLLLALLATQAEPQTIQSDGFDAASIDGAVWTLVDPVGGALARVAGAGTSESVLELVVPAGSSHDAWVENRSVRLLQAAADTDLDVELRFTSAPAAGYQMQGVLVQQDPGTYLRFDCFFDGSTSYIFAATFANGSAKTRLRQAIPAAAELYLAVVRTGHVWTLSYSANGVDWTAAAPFSFAMAVSAIGPFAGTHSFTGPAPELTARVDYFDSFHDAEPSPSGEPSGESPPPAGAGAFVSDDFSAPAFDTGVWEAVDPLGDASFALGGEGGSARLEIGVPAGPQHRVWTEGISAPRVRQAVGDVDFTVEAKFDSELLHRYQEQGLVVEGASDDSYLRADLYSNGSSTYLFASSFAGGAVAVRYNKKLVAVAPFYLRLTRSGDAWSLEHSPDGQSWITYASFTHVMAVSTVGVYAGNEGAPAPAYTSYIDYVFDATAPIVPEDGDGGGSGGDDGSSDDGSSSGGEDDTVAPSISGLAASPGIDEITVSWDTSEPATTVVEYGETTTYEQGSVSILDLATDHAVIVDGLSPAVTYQLRVVATDAAGNTATSANLSVTTAAAGAGPWIDVWYGARQVFGQNGKPIPWVNILGHVSDPDGVAYMTWSLNGGPAYPLSLGPQENARLAADGDFNVELAFASLAAGENDLVLRAVDSHGNASSTAVEVVRANVPTPSVSQSIAWQDVAAIEDVGQVIDGLWGIEGDTVRPLRLGYDRLIGFGDLAWTDYEVTVPVRVQYVDPAGYPAPSYGPLVGFAMRWPGHTQRSTESPRVGFYPLGAMGWYRWFEGKPGRFQILGNNGYILDQAKTTDTLDVGVQYVFKMRVETIDGQVYYRMKVWPQGSAEPSDWKLTGIQSASSDPGSGSLLLVAHHVDARFGTVTVTPLGGSSDGGDGSGSEPGGDDDGGAPAGVVSDDFSGAAVDGGLWTFVDPLGDASHEIVAVGDGQRQLAIHVPGGASHDVWTNGNDAPRLLQDVEDGDFGIEAKFDSTVGARYQIQGIIVEGAPGNLLRFDFFSTHKDVRVFAAAFTGGSPVTHANAQIPQGGDLFLRVRREGDLWTQEISLNGADWFETASFAHAIEVRRVGVFAGNAGTSSEPAPAHTALIDYFFETQTPIEPEDGV